MEPLRATAIGVRTRERRRPATLRTKTGCHNCRSRKRKCDEQHPTCLACAKRHLSCSWPQMQASERPLRALPDRDLARGLRLGLTDVTDSLLHHYTSRLCAVLLNRHAHPDYARLFLQSSILPKLQLMVEPLLACASLDLSRQLPSHSSSSNSSNSSNSAQVDDYQRLAWTYYARAVTRTRNSIARKRVQGTEDWLLLNVLHLNLFETWSAGDGMGGSHMNTKTPVLLHIQGAAQILKLKLQTSSSSTPQPLRLPRSTSDMVVARIAAEAFVYHTVNWSMFFLFHGHTLNASHGLQNARMPAPDAALWDGLQPYLELRPFPDASDAQNSPVLGVPWQLYRFLSDLASLRGQAPNASSTLSTLSTLSTSLDDWDVDDNRARLFVLALKLLLLKFQDASVATRDGRVQRLVGDATRLLQDTHVERTDFWPLLVVGSAAVDHAQIALLRATLEAMARTMHSVAFVKTKCALEAIWADDAGDGLARLLGGSGVP